MDDLKQKLQTYYEQAAPTEEFMQHLLHLEETTDAPPVLRRRSRRKYLIPLAAMLAVAVAVGGGWRYLRQTMPQDPPEPAPQSAKPAQEQIPAPDAGTKPSLPPAADPGPKKPAKSGQTSKPTDVPETGKQPEVPSAAPDGGTEPSANGTQPEKPASDPAPAGSDPKPAEPASDPGSPGKSDSPGKEEPPAEKPDPPKEEPPEEIPDPPKEEPPAPISLSAGFYSSGGQDYVTVTNNATGETVTFDVTGLCPAPRQGDPGEEGKSGFASVEQTSESEKDYYFQRSAFGCDISISVTRDAAGGAYVYARPVS